jgi:hypothetical protein
MGFPWDSKAPASSTIPDISSLEMIPLSMSFRTSAMNRAAFAPRGRGLLLPRLGEFTGARFELLFQLDQWCWVLSRGRPANCSLCLTSQRGRPAAACQRPQRSSGTCRAPGSARRSFVPIRNQLWAARRSRNRWRRSTTIGRARLISRGHFGERDTPVRRQVREPVNWARR